MEWLKKLYVLAHHHFEDALAVVYNFIIYSFLCSSRNITYDNLLIHITSYIHRCKIVLDEYSTCSTIHVI